MFTINTDIVRFLDLPFVDVLKKEKKKKKNNARQSYGSRRSPQIVSGYRAKAVRCPYGVPARSDTSGKENAFLGS